MRFATDDRVTVTDPKDWCYGEHGVVEDYDCDGRGGQIVYHVQLDRRDFQARFTVDQLDFTEEGEAA